MMATKIIPPAEGAYAYPLLIKQLLLSGVRYEPGREIVYADKLRYTTRRSTSGFANWPTP